MKPRIKKQTHPSPIPQHQLNDSSKDLQTVSKIVEEKKDLAAIPAPSAIISYSPIIQPVSRMSEKDIADIQIERLRIISMDRELTLEETRKLEIFTKIKLMIERPDRPIDVTPLPKDEKDLLVIAATQTSLEKKMEDE